MADRSPAQPGARRAVEHDAAAGTRRALTTALAHAAAGAARHPQLTPRAHVAAGVRTRLPHDCRHPGQAECRRGAGLDLPLHWQRVTGAVPMVATFGLPCWCLHSDGLQALGQDEIVIIVRYASEVPQHGPPFASDALQSDLEHPPLDVVALIETVYELAESGIRLRSGSHVEFARSEHPFMRDPLYSGVLFTSYMGQVGAALLCLQSRAAGHQRARAAAATVPVWHSAQGARAGVGAALSDPPLAHVRACSAASHGHCSRLGRQTETDFPFVLHNYPLREPCITSRRTLDAALFLSQGVCIARVSIGSDARQVRVPHVVALRSNNEHSAGNMFLYLPLEEKDAVAQAMAAIPADDEFVVQCG